MKYKKEELLKELESEFEEMRRNVDPISRAAVIHAYIEYIAMAGNGGAIVDMPKPNGGYESCRLKGDAVMKYLKDAAHEEVNKLCCMAMDNMFGKEEEEYTDFTNSDNDKLN